ncbi:MAG: cellulase family glycosylhydrolase [Prevotellaceae bacterium]|jgi:mannan endo-1,4-beta-mannosidase|nr:cellulase family glycosylhydrolase [Prevotellaceae bacterium]
MKHLLLLFSLPLLWAGCSSGSTDSPFVRVNGQGQFVRNGQPYYYVGTNLWYGALLGSTGEGGNRDRLHRELDLLKEIGIKNLRVLVGADGTNDVSVRVRPALQSAPGVYNDTILDGLDYFMNELRKRDMTAVLYLNNAWEWSGGFSMYLEWTGHGRAAIPAVDGYEAYTAYVTQFVRSDSARALFAKHVEFIVSRTNRYSEVKYVDDPTLMAWQICNEPRAFSQASKEPFARWLAEVAAQIKRLDPHHLVSTGSEGSWGCENDLQLYEQIHADPNIDYLTIHIWPYNWSWVKADSLTQMLPQAKAYTQAYLDEHLALAQKLRKPLVLEEFGYPRDGFLFSKDTPVTARDSYYQYLFDRVRADREQGAWLAGCNFWAWGGLAKQTPTHIYWKRGDDYTGDPAQEQQGLYAVYATDSTVEVIRSATK